jgi:hypothetical protein
MDTQQKVKEFQDILQAILSDYQIRLRIMDTRSQLLAQIRVSKGVITPARARSLLNLLERERGILGHLSNEGKLEIGYIETAIRTLRKGRRNSAMLKELERRNISYRGLELTTDVGLGILKQMKKRLHNIEKRILMEEGLIGHLMEDSSKQEEGIPINSNEAFKIYLNVWYDEIMEEEKFRMFVIGSRLPAEGYAALGTGLGGLELAGTYYANAAKMAGGGSSDIRLVAIGASIGIIIILAGFTTAFISLIKANQKRIDLHSEEVLEDLKSGKLSRKF